MTLSFSIARTTTPHSTQTPYTTGTRPTSAFHTIRKRALKTLTHVFRSSAIALKSIASALISRCSSTPKRHFIIVSESSSSTSKYPQLINTLGAWKSFAEEKLNRENNQSIKEILTSSIQLTKGLHEGFQDSENLRITYDNLHRCFDVSSGQLQALALTTRAGRFLELLDLVTNPNNIPSSYPVQHKNVVRGAGTAIITHLAKEVLKNNLDGIILQSFASAVPFYTKLGFVEVIQQRPLGALMLSLTPMILSTDKIQLLLKKKGIQG